MSTINIFEYELELQNYQYDALNANFTACSSSSRLRDALTFTGI